MSEALSEAEERFELLGASHKPFALPLLKAIENEGGEAKRKPARNAAWEIIGDKLTEAQRAYLQKNNRLGWTRFALKKRGFLTGERGVWRLTEQARIYLDTHRDDPIEVPSDIPELDPSQVPPKGAPTESVTVTAQPAYYVPILEVLTSGAKKRRDLLAAVREKMSTRMLEGDLRQMPGGRIVWRYRTSWALTSLKSRGLVRSTGRGRWEITDSGRTHLEQDRRSWDGELPMGKAKVRLKGSEVEQPPIESPLEEVPSWEPPRWAACRTTIGDEIFSAVTRRLRPELGPDPASAIARNLILYGPPGTGKTWVALQVAVALTGQDEPGPENLWRLVQFHPSYAYEDFIQGLRPDLEQKDLRYKLATGPFLELCQAASEDSDRFYVLVIDEINRGDPARIFGELLYALEYRDNPVDLALGSQLTVPKNVIILGTMNSVDRSVALVDYALRRRFGFVRVDPNAELVTSIRGNEPSAALAAKVLDFMNDWLAEELDVDHMLGHSFFLNESIPLDSEKALDSIWQLDIKPLLEEYFFGDGDRLRRAHAKWKDSISRAGADTDDAEDQGEPE